MQGRKRRKLVTRVLVAAVLLAIVGFIAKGFVTQPISVSLGRATLRPLEVTIEESGKTRVRGRYVVSAPVLGHLARISLKVGDVVEAGTIVAELAPMKSGLLDDRTRSEARARVMVAQANVDRTRAVIKRAQIAVDFAREQVARQRALRDGQGTSQQVLEQAEFALRAAEEELATAIFTEKVAQQEFALAQTAIASMSGEKSAGTLALSAPVSGRVLRVYQESEGVVQPGSPLVEVGDPTNLEIVVDVLTSDAVKIAEGAEASIDRWGGDRILKARVRAKEPAAFTTRSALGVEEQRVAVLLDLVDRPETWSALGDGFRVETKIRTAFIPNALVAPASAVFRVSAGWAAFVVGSDGKVRATTIEVGARTPDWVEVKQGLKPQAEVVLYPSDQVRDGSLVAGEQPNS